ncbi:MAG: hypothetical protein MSA07_00895 [Mucispirillum sp.]|nr:hypothetical protein [Mucispirillum sp.]
MQILSNNELIDIEEEIGIMFTEHSEKIITNLNRECRLKEFLELIKRYDLVSKYYNYDSTVFSKTGKIAIIGNSTAKKDILIKIAKEYNISANRLEMCLDYETIKTYQFKKLEYNWDYCLIFAGAMPHKTTGSGDYSSAIQNIKKNYDKYPKLIEIGNGKLDNITKSNFKTALHNAVLNGYIE